MKLDSVSDITVACLITRCVFHSWILELLGVGWGVGGGGEGGEAS
jgi:hypothetical protein